MPKKMKSKKPPAFLKGEGASAMAPLFKKKKGGAKRGNADAAMLKRTRMPA